MRDVLSFVVLVILFFVLAWGVSINGHHHQIHFDSKQGLILE